MAAMDMEEQQQLLEDTAPARSPLGRALAWAAAGLGAVAAVAVLAHASESPAVATGPKVHDAFAESLQQLSAGFAKIRKMTGKDAAAVTSEDAAAEEEEVEALECEGDMLGLEFCGAEESDMETKCTDYCLTKYTDLLEKCGPKLKEKSKDLAGLLTACSKHLDEAKEKAKEEEATEKPVDEAELAKQLECMPLMLQMAADCHVNQEPSESSICADACQASVSNLQKTCQKVLGDEVPLGAMLSMCAGCGRAFMKFGSPDSPGSKACDLKDGGFESDDVDACGEACHPFVCDLTKSCPVGVDSGIPGLGETMISEMHGTIEKKTAKCAC